MKHAYNIYKAVVMLAGVAGLTFSTVLHPVNNLASVLFFMLLALTAEAMSCLADSRRILYVGSASATAAMLTAGPTAAILTTSVCLLGSAARFCKPKMNLRDRTADTLFEPSCRIVSCAVMCLVYFGLGGILMEKSTLSQFHVWLAPLAAAILLGALIDILLATAGALLERRGSWHGAINHRLPAMAESTLMGLLGAFVTLLYISYGWSLAVLFYVPLLLAYCALITYQTLRENYIQTVDCLASAIEAKDAYTSGHSKRVEQYSGLIAHELKFSEKRCENLRYAAILHDIGKIGIPERILNKPDKLNEDEWAYIKSHSEKGAHILGDIAFLRDAVEIVRSHHEWYNGGGYPDGKSAGNMPVEAMVICVADAYDAMTSDRPYRMRLPAEQAMSELHTMAGIQFSPEIVDAFERAMVKSGGI